METFSLLYFLPKYFTLLKECYLFFINGLNYHLLFEFWQVQSMIWMEFSSWKVSVAFKMTHILVLCLCWSNVMCEKYCMCAPTESGVVMGFSISYDYAIGVSYEWLSLSLHLQVAGICIISKWFFQIIEYWMTYKMAKKNLVLCVVV